MTYQVVIEKKASIFLSELPEKSQRIIKNRCRILVDDPFPGKGGDRELLHLDYKLYRLHVGRSYTVFHKICDKEKMVKILEIVPIDQAHKMYGRF